MIYEKFGKSFRDISGLKVSFFQENEKHLQRSAHHADLYLQQKRREKCKICDNILPTEYSFVKNKIPYVICTSCGHLNGQHEDTDSFCEAIYTSQGGKEYAENYTEEDSSAYLRRRAAIYTPKADFLLNVLRHQGENPESLAYADMGAGAGYFVSAMRELGISNVSGFEVGRAQVDLGNWIMPSEPLQLIGLHDTVGLVETLPVDVMSFIGVFEHLQDPRAILAAMKKNPRTKYFYFCVPMFGPCIYNEMSFPEIMPRQLTGGHTHLFTKSSIEHFEKEFGFQRVGAWWFGTDVMDYYRSIQVTLAKNQELSKMCDPWSELFEPMIDEMQIAIDRQRQSSQVHMVMRVRD